MTYIVPHFRYGALIYHDIRNENDEPSSKVMERVQIQFNKVAKKMYELPINTPNNKLNKTLGS